jgi:hypothetical protein
VWFLQLIELVFHQVIGKCPEKFFLQLRSLSSARTPNSINLEPNNTAKTFDSVNFHRRRDWLQIVKSKSLTFIIWPKEYPNHDCWEDMLNVSSNVMCFSFSVCNLSNSSSIIWRIWGIIDCRKPKWNVLDYDFTFTPPFIAFYKFHVSAKQS